MGERGKGETGAWAHGSVGAWEIEGRGTGFPVTRASCPRFQQVARAVRPCILLITAKMAVPYFEHEHEGRRAAKKPLRLPRPLR
jgi:hypothetical protein